MAQMGLMTNIINDLGQKVAQMSMGATADQIMIPTTAEVTPLKGEKPAFETNGSTAKKTKTRSLPPVDPISPTEEQTIQQQTAQKTTDTGARNPTPTSDPTNAPPSLTSTPPEDQAQTNTSHTSKAMSTTNGSWY